MDVEEILKELINKTGMSVKAFSAKAGLPYSTLRSMLERNIGNASVNNVIKVCQELGISVEELQEMSKSNIIKTNSSNANNSFSTKENNLISKYRQLDEKGKHTINTVLDMEYNRCLNEKSHLIPVAAHDKENVDKNSTTYEEDNKHDLNIMMNDDEWK